MILNQAIGGNSVDNLNEKAFSVDFRIDWICIHIWNQFLAYMLKMKAGRGSGVIQNLK
jgi:hypothetical protein